MESTTEASSFGITSALEQPWKYRQKKNDEGNVVDKDSLLGGNPPGNISFQVSTIFWCNFGQRINHKK